MDFRFQRGKLIITPKLVTVADSSKNCKQILSELAVAVAELRHDAKKKGLNKMPMIEINRAVDAARRGLKKAAKRPSK